MQPSEPPRKDQFYRFIGEGVVGIVIVVLFWWVVGWGYHLILNHGWTLWKIGMIVAVSLWIRDLTKQKPPK